MFNLSFYENSAIIMKAGFHNTIIRKSNNTNDHSIYVVLSNLIHTKPLKGLTLTIARTNIPASYKK